MKLKQIFVKRELKKNNKKSEPVILAHFLLDDYVYFSKK
ncbi:hypothetical protein RV00_GL001840 [Enterococcus devriesei]|uniref:Uncharacterized protein n=1 Tax=Enterococcus devriesei TaxID=319970 RepID=A0A1L8SWP2_9ENTE|nr:hypothetical protein RV00_GL001840 [Enterococcus devriesei]